MSAKREEFTGPGGTLRFKEGDEAAVDLAMLIEGETSGRPLAEILEEFGRSRSTYFAKLARFRDAGLAGLLRRPSGPRAPWRMSHEIIRLIVAARLEDKTRSAAAIARDLERHGHEISVRSVERLLEGM